MGFCSPVERISLKIGSFLLLEMKKSVLDFVVNYVQDSSGSRLVGALPTLSLIIGGIEPPL